MDGPFTVRPFTARTEPAPMTQIAPTVSRPAARLAGLGAFLVLCLAVYAANGLVTAVSVGDWYQTLAKPPFNPPDWIFGPVWTVLFILIAVAGWRLWRATGGSSALVAWGVQLALNLIWSVLFFGLQAVGAALVEIVLLLGAILTTIALAWRHNRVAALLLTPYAAWVAFAAVLNAALWALN